MKLESTATGATMDTDYEDGLFVTLRVAKYRNRMPTEVVVSPFFKIPKT